jgi:hypothetical protein
MDMSPKKIYSQQTHEKMLTSLATREMQMKTILTHHFASTASVKFAFSLSLSLFWILHSPVWP